MKHTIRPIIISLAILLMASLFGAAAAFGAISNSGLSDEYSKYYHNERFKNAIAVNGIDISAWQNTISVSTFKKMKAKGVDFVILRLGYTGSVSFKPTIDDCFEKNYVNAKAAGMEIGIYYYSLATKKYKAKTTPKVKKWVSAQEEAQYVIKHLKDKEITYPIFMDVEDNVNQKPLTKAKMADVANYFCYLIEKANPDYEAGVYASLSWLTGQIGTIKSSYDIWAAQYYYQCLYTKPYIMWQYSSSGKLSCFEKRLDVNFRYFDDSVSTGKNSLTEAEVKLGSKSLTYGANQKKPSVTVTLDGKTLTKDIDYTVAYYKNVAVGTAYAVVTGKGSYRDCKIAPFTIKKKSMSNYEISSIPDQTFSLKGSKPSITVKNKSTGNTLSSSYYTVKYTDYKKVGTATVTVTGQKNYKDSISKTFKIKTLSPKLKAPASISKNGKCSFNINATSNGDGVLKYNSDNADVATVDEKGRVTTHGFGSANISITSPKTENCNKVTASVTINVAGQPKDIKVSDLTSNSGTLTWDGTKLGKSFTIYKYDSDSGKYVKYAATKEPTLKLTGLKKNTKYSFKIKAKDANGTYGKESEVFTFTTKLPKVSNLKASYVKAKSLTLSWSKVSGATGYKVYKGLKTSKYTTLYTKLSAKDKTKVSVKGLKSKKTYVFKVYPMAGSLKGMPRTITVTTK